MVVQVKKEVIEQNLGRSAVEMRRQSGPPEFDSVIELSSSSDSDDGDGEADEPVSAKRARVCGESSTAASSRSKAVDDVLPVGFLDPLPPVDAPALLQLPAPPTTQVGLSPFKQFWKAGDYEGAQNDANWDSSTGGMDHVRVHPKFLHSNATSHKWALGAFAELLDNALDEVCNGATYVNIDMLRNSKDGTPTLLIEDNGGGMDPEKLRQCMSLGYSAKSKISNTIGQYGNGFKTSTMRLGADVIVFSRCPGKDGRSHTQSVGLLSYTFLRSSGKDDIVVPILDYERKGGKWEKIIRSSAEDWGRNVDTIVQWSPFASEAQLLKQFYMMRDHGTRIIIYNLWEDDQGQLELDFNSDPHDIQLRGVSRDEKNIKMAKEFPNSKHFLTYRHSLRSYASILYLRLPPNFRIILRGKDVEHHNIVNDMMLSQEVTYRPQASADGVPRDTNMVAVVTIGFVKDARAHIDVQGFNVYHKNRLIKPFWRVWNASGSHGRGVIGLLEANFVEPAHDKQGFERTTVLARLETKLVNMQKTFWYNYCHKIGYAPKGNNNRLQSPTRESSFEYMPNRAKRKVSESDKSYTPSGYKLREKASKSNKIVNGNVHGKASSRTGGGGRSSPEEASSSSANASSEDDSEPDVLEIRNASANQKPTSSRKHGSHPLFSPVTLTSTVSPLGKSVGKSDGTCTYSVSKGVIHVNNMPSISDPQVLEKLKVENRQLKERLEKREEEILGELIRDLQYERDKRILLENKLQQAERKIHELNSEQDSLINIFSEERDRRDTEEEKMRKELKEKSTAIQGLLEKVRLLESSNSTSWKY